MEAPHITSAANPRFKHARALLRRRGRRQNRQLLLEGVRLIEDSISAGYPPALFFFEPEKEPEIRALVEQVQALGGEALSLAPALMAELCSTVTPQGVVAVTPWPDIPAGTTGLSVVVDGVRDPGNLGTLLRSAAGANVDQVITLPGVTDVWAPKVLRAGMGAHFRLAVRQAGSLEQVEAWVGAAVRRLADARARTLYTEVDWTQSSVLLIRGETEGQRLTASWPELQPVAIPLERGIESLNAAVAASVILFEAARQRREQSGG